MVPLTVEREIISETSEIIDGKKVTTKIKEKGSFQLWVENFHETSNLVVPFPPDVRFFDLLINNRDRGNHNYGYLPRIGGPRARNSQKNLMLVLANDGERGVLFDNAFSFRECLSAL